MLLPAKPEEVCEYIYGNNWRKPVSKSNGDYIHRIIANRPVFIERTDLAYTIAKQLYAEEHEMAVLLERLKIADYDRSNLRSQILAILDEKNGPLSNVERKVNDIIMIRFKSSTAMDVVLSEFDSDFYNAAHPDVASAKIDPLDHYFEFGRNEKREIRLSTFRDKKLKHD